MPLPFYDEVNNLKLNKSPYDDCESIQLILEIVTNYTPTGHPIDESLMYIVCSKYKELKKLFTTDNQKIVNEWIFKLGDLQMKYINTNTTINNNWLAHQIKTVAICGDTLNNKIFLEWANKNLVSFIHATIYPDNSCLDFKERDSLTYVTYVLNALILSILALKTHYTTDYYNMKTKNNSSIKNAVYFLKPYIEGAKHNMMFVKSIYASDKVIHADQYNKQWEKNDAKQLLLNAMILDPSLKTYYDLHFK